MQLLRLNIQLHCVLGPGRWHPAGPKHTTGRIIVVVALFSKYRGWGGKGEGGFEYMTHSRFLLSHRYLLLLLLAFGGPVRASLCARTRTHTPAAHGNKHPIKARPPHITVIKAPALAFMGFLIMSICLPGVASSQFMMSSSHLVKTRGVGGPKTSRPRG